MSLKAAFWALQKAVVRELPVTYSMNSISTGLGGIGGGWGEEKGKREGEFDGNSGMGGGKRTPEIVD